MKLYAKNSSQAMSRVIAIMMVTDGAIDEREIAVLDQLNAYATLGLSRQEFMQVARDYCHDLVCEANAWGDTPLIDPHRTDHVLSAVTEPS